MKSSLKFKHHILFGIHSDCDKLWWSEDSTDCLRKNNRLMLLRSFKTKEPKLSCWLAVQLHLSIIKRPKRVRIFIFLINILLLCRKQNERSINYSNFSIVREHYSLFDWKIISKMLANLYIFSLLNLAFMATVLCNRWTSKWTVCFVKKNLLNFKITEFASHKTQTNFVQISS